MTLHFQLGKYNKIQLLNFLTASWSHVSRLQNPLQKKKKNTQ